MERVTGPKLGLYIGWAIAFVIAVIAAWTVATLQIAAQSRGATAPVFQAKDTAREQFSLLDITRDQALLIIFCDPAAEPKKSIRWLEHGLQLKSVLAEQPLKITAVVPMPHEAAEEFTLTEQRTLPVIPDPSRAIFEKFGIEGSSAYVLVGRGHRLIGVWNEPTPDDAAAIERAMTQELKSSLGEMPPWPIP